MTLGEFRKVTAHMPDSADIVAQGRTWEPPYLAGTANSIVVGEDTVYLCHRPKEKGSAANAKPE